MSWQNTIFVYPLLFGFVVSFVLAGYTALRIRNQVRSSLLVSFLAITISLALWSGFSALKLLSTVETTKLLFYQALHVSVAPLGPLTLLFALAYTDRQQWIRRSVIAALFAIPLAYALVLVINPANLAWESTHLFEVGVPITDSIVVMRVTDGPFHLLYLVFTVVCVIAALGIVARETLYLGRRYVPQTLLLGVAITAPILFGVFATLGVSPFDHEGVNLVPMSASIVALAFGAAVFRYQLFELPPIAYQSAIRDSPDGYFVTDSTGRIAHANGRGGALLDEFGAELDAVIESMTPTSAAEARAVTVELGTQSGSTEHYDVRSRPVENAGRTVGFVTVCTDVTGRTKRERELRETRDALERRNKWLDRFASVISHDLRNPLAVAAGYAALAEETGDAGAFRELHGAHERMESMIDELLVLARTETLADERTAVPVAESARSAWEIVDSAGATLDLDLPPTFTVDGNPELLSHIFTNLFRNAIEHNEPPVAVTVGCIEDDGPVGFSVEDDGRGILRDVQGPIFEPGVTSNERGTGLGLTIVREFTEALDWDISVVDAADGGARFELLTGSSRA